MLVVIRKKRTIDILESLLVSAVIEATLTETLLVFSTIFLVHTHHQKTSHTAKSKMVMITRRMNHARGKNPVCYIADKTRKPFIVETRTVEACKMKQNLLIRSAAVVGDI